MSPVGTRVTTAVRSGPTSRLVAPGSPFFVAGITERGDTAAAVRVSSMQEYADLLGGRVSYGAVYDALRCYFEEGGTRAFVARVVGAGAAVGDLVLVDRAGAPVNTLRIDAKDSGAWSANVTVEVAAGSVAGTYRLVIRYAGTGGPGIEVYDNLVTPADAVQKLATSAYVRGTDLASATVAPNNQPAILAPTALSAGTDDRATVVAATHTAALVKFPKPLGPGAVAIPGQGSAAVGPLLMAHAAANYRIALLAAAAGANDAATIAEAQALRANVGAEFTGLAGPWVQMPDDAGGIRLVSPEGFVAGVRARVQQLRGPFRAAAGELAAARFVVGVERVIDEAATNNLNDGEVIPIRVVGGRVQPYGWRSLSLDEVNYSLLTGRDVLNDLASQAEADAQALAFETIDGEGKVFSDLAAILLAIVQPMRARGGLYPQRDGAGNEIDPGYRVDTGPAVNTPDSLAANQLRGVMSVRPSPTGQLVDILITKATVTASL